VRTLPPGKPVPSVWVRCSVLLPFTSCKRV
jgi:hypothetical protein